MTFFQAILYFLREASISLLRSWKISLLAIVTISVSLFVSGLVFLTSRNLAELVRDWREQTKVVIYLEDDPPAETVAEVARLAGEPSWVVQMEEIDAEEAAERFRRAFPSLSELVEGWEEDPLPASLEVAFDSRRLAEGEFDSWLEALRQHPAVSVVDDDRDWLAQLATLITIVRGIGLTLGAVLLAAAIFTIGSVIRLIAYLYQEEIAIMRVVGATEFFIRGPFYCEGLLQGLIGGLLALGGLASAHALLQVETSTSLWGAALVAKFLSWEQQLLLVLLGGAGGLLGAILSLRRETLRAPVDEGAS